MPFALSALAAGLLGAHAVDGPPVGERRRPRLHRATRGVVARRQAPQFDERLLRDFLALGRIAHDLQHDAVQQRGQRVVEIGERRLVTSTRTTQQRAERILGGFIVIVVAASPAKSALRSMCLPSPRFDDQKRGPVSHVTRS